MKERIRNMIDLINAGRYDEEQTHMDYDMLLEDFIKAFGVHDKSTVQLMIALIDLKKDFWYA